ncbi:MAG TPA: multidrug effflux MFS transporter [Pseudolabrys sp.]|jgi:DHA1 family bicyclomycin/chloramphenicol resistance-like MFS transporter|nr:multidrug effflux MFS transporter [Pseudolabrys sp.]
MLRPGTFALTGLLAALSAIGPLTTDMYLPSLPDIARQLHASTAQVQFTISAYLIGFAIGQIFYGPVSDRHGRKPVLMAAMVLYCVASLACALSTSIEMLIIARTFQALGGSGGIVLARAIVRDIYAGARAGRELSLIGSVMALAPVLAPIAGGLLQTGFGWRAIFFALVVAGLLGAGIVWLLLPETLNTRAAEPVSIASMGRSYRIVVRHPAYRAYLGIAAASYAGLFAWISGAAFVLQNLYGLTPFDFGVAFALGSIGYMTGSALAARIVVRLGIDGVLGVGGCACAVGGLGMVAAVSLGLTSSLWLVAPVAIYLAGLGMVLPQGIAGAMTPFPERAGAASSLFGFVQQSAAAVCGAIVGWFLGHSAWPLVLGVAVMGCTTLVLWLATRGIRGRAVKH